MSARTQQAAGVFRLPWNLGRQLRTDPQIFKSLTNVRAPLAGLSNSFSTNDPKGARERVRKEAVETFDPKKSQRLAMGMLISAIECLFMHGFAILVNDVEARADGSRIDFGVRFWPLDAVRWDGWRQRLIAITTEGEEVIEHGNGRWTIIAQHSYAPWQHAALLALAGVWMDRVGAIQDRASNAESHGEEKWLGWLPDGVAIEHPSGAKMLSEMVALYQRRRAAVFPHGSEIKREEALGQNWQIFKEIIASDNGDVAGVLLGQEVTPIGSNYVKDQFLFGIRSDIIEGALRCISVALASGVFRPWSLINFGFYDGLILEWLMPDPDEDARRKSYAERHQALARICADYARAGFVVTDDFVSTVAKELGVPAPKLRPSEEAPPGPGAAAGEAPGTEDPAAAAPPTE